MVASKKVLWLICLFASVILLISLTACTDNAGNQPTAIANHQTYAYNADVSQAISQNWHPGDTIQVKWNAKAYQLIGDPNPVQLKLSLQLTGPFVSKQDALNQPNKAPIVSSSPIQTNDWTSQTFTSAVILPTDLAPGDYTLTQQINFGSNVGDKTTAGTTIHVIK